MKLNGKLIKVAGSGISMSGDGPSFEMGKDVQVFLKSIAMYSEKGGIELAQNAILKGDKVYVELRPLEAVEPGRRRQAGDAAVPACQVLDFDLKPYANKTYHLRAQGLKTEGKTDGEGTVTAKVPKDTKQVVVTVWIDDYPTGRRKTYTLEHEEVPPATTPKGAQFRLKHLGYFFGEPGDEWTDDAKAAVLGFQNDHQQSYALQPSGELDWAHAGRAEGCVRLVTA